MPAEESEQIKAPASVGAAQVNQRPSGAYADDF